MKEIAHYYTSVVNQQLVTYWATWGPDTSLQLGDVGILEGAIFRRQSDLMTLCNIPFSERQADGHAAQYTFNSNKSTKIITTAKGEVDLAGSASAKAKMEIRFGEADSVYFNAAGCQLFSIADQIGLGKQLIKLYEHDNWDHNLYVVTGVVHAGATTVIVSASKNANIMLEADGDIPHIEMASADLELGVASETGIGFKAVTKKNATPLIQLSALRKKSLFNQRRVFRLTDGDDEGLTEDFKRNVREANLSFDDMVEFTEILPA